MKRRNSDGLEPRKSTGKADELAATASILPPEKKPSIP
jgi:hypothetical protein